MSETVGATAGEELMLEFSAAFPDLYTVADLAAPKDACRHP